MVNFYRWEPLNHLLNTGIIELGERSWDEIGNDKDIFKYNPDWARYQQLQDDNMLRFFVIRDDEEILLGYASVVIQHNLHDRSVLCAIIQDIYLEKEARKGFEIGKFMKELERQLGDVGVKHISVAERENDERGGVGVVWKRLGYSSAERIWTKGI